MLGSSLNVVDAEFDDAVSELEAAARASVGLVELAVGSHSVAKEASPFSFGERGDPPRCRRISPQAFLPVIRKHISSLQHLLLQQCLLVEADVAVEVLQSCRELKTLDLRGCINVNLANALPCGVGSLSSLHTLVLSGVALSDKFLTSLAARCGELQILDLSRQYGPLWTSRLTSNEAITEYGVSSLLCANTHLRNLNLALCPVNFRAKHFTTSLLALCHIRLAERASEELPWFFRNLTQLTLDGCSMDATALFVWSRLTGVLERLSAARGFVYISDGADSANSKLESTLLIESALAEFVDANIRTLKEFDASGLRDCTAVAALMESRTLIELNVRGCHADIADLNKEDPWIFMNMLFKLPVLRILNASWCDLKSFELPNIDVYKINVFDCLEVLRIDGNPDLPVTHISELLRRAAVGRIPLRELGIRLTVRKQAGYWKRKLPIWKGAVRSAFPRGKKRRLSSLDFAFFDCLDAQKPALSSRLFSWVEDGTRLPLEVLDVSGCRLLKHELEKIPELCPALTDFRFGVGIGLGNYSGAGPHEYTQVDIAVLLKNLVQHCPKLIIFGMFVVDCHHYGEPKLDTIALIEFLHARGHQLVELRMEGKGRDSDPFDPSAFESLPELCPKLRVLELVNLYSASDPDEDDAFCLELSRRLPACTVHAISGYVMQRGRLVLR